VHIKERKSVEARRQRNTARTATSADLLDAISKVENAGGTGTINLPAGQLDVTNIGKVYFPATGHTKGDIMRYYVKVAPMVLPAIDDRPLVMKRYPDGVNGKSFYQQRAPKDSPVSVRVERVSDAGGSAQRKLIGGDLATLLYSVQLGAVSVDPWHCRVQSTAFADYVIIDLDPGPKVPFGRVVEVALAVKHVLDGHGLRSFPKTSGASGLHIMIPLVSGISYDLARSHARVIAERTADDFPELATVVRPVRKRRRGTVYVDYLQNVRGKTVAAAYSVRARPTPTVSTPLRWKDVTEALDPGAFTVDSVPDRLRSVGDLWAEGMLHSNSLNGLATDA
jgi:bifunctional non-homologous end joining protein LigD